MGNGRWVGLDVEFSNGIGMDSEGGDGCEMGRGGVTVRLLVMVDAFGVYVCVVVVTDQ